MRILRQECGRISSELAFPLNAMYEFESLERKILVGTDIGTIHNEYLT